MMLQVASHSFTGMYKQNWIVMETVRQPCTVKTCMWCWFNPASARSCLTCHVIMLEIHLWISSYEIEKYASQSDTPII